MQDKVVILILSSDLDLKANPKLIIEYPLKIANLLKVIIYLRNLISQMINAPLKIKQSIESKR